MFNVEKTGGGGGVIFSHEDLDFTEVIFDFDEGDFAEATDGGDAAGDGDGLVF